MNKNSRMRLGLIGCGTMGEVHRARFERNADRMEVAVCVDTDTERAQKAAALFGAKAAKNYREVLDDLDAVLIALPHHLHHSVGMECLMAGKHVLMEKPLANTESQCLDLIGAAKQFGLTLMVGYNQRYHPLIHKMQELIACKTYGETFHVSMWTEQLTQCSPDSWVARTETMGGGQLFSHGCHYIDLLLWFLGEPKSGMHFGTRSGTPWLEGEGTSDVSIKFVSGALGYHGATWGARGTRLGYSFHAHTDQGMIEVDQFRGVCLFHRGDPHSGTQRDGELLLEVETGNLAKHTDLEMAHFLDCIESGKEPLTNAPDSLQSLRIIWRLYEAEQRGVVADLQGLGLN